MTSSRRNDTQFPGFEHLWRIGDPVRSKYVRLRLESAVGDLDPLSLLRGESPPPPDLAVRVAHGHQTDPFLWTTSGNLVVLRSSVVRTLVDQGVTGWGRYQLGDPTGQLGEVWGLTVLGRCGALDDRRVEWVERTLPGGTYAYAKGVYFDERSWDGSDIFSTADSTGFCFVTERVVRCLAQLDPKNIKLERLTDVLRPKSAL